MSTSATLAADSSVTPTRAGCSCRYTASILLLLSWRAKIFTAKKWHYFLLDFCYFINAMCLVYLALTHLHPWCGHTRQRCHPSTAAHCSTLQHTAAALPHCRTASAPASAQSHTAR